MKKKILLIAETNFIVSNVLEGDLTCGYLLLLAENEEIELAIPDYSFCEADGTIQKRLTGYITRFERMSSELKDVRGSSYIQFCNKIRQDLKDLKQKVIVDQDLYEQKINDIKNTVTVIPSNYEIFNRARFRYISSKPPYKLSDCEIYEAIKDFVKQIGQIGQIDYESIIFYTADKEDFDHPKIHNELQEIGVKICFKSGEVVRKILAYLR
ncbi:MAG: PIN domain-containing protein [Methanosarcinales archaeon]